MSKCQTTASQNANRITVADNMACFLRSYARSNPRYRRGSRRTGDHWIGMKCVNTPDGAQPSGLEAGVEAACAMLSMLQLGLHVLHVGLADAEVKLQ